MKKLIAQFDIIDRDGTTRDCFVWYKDSNNHHSISNWSGCLYDGYEGETEWQRIKNDMSMVEMLGMSIDNVR